MSNFLNLNVDDLVKGFIVAFLSTALTGVVATLDSGALVMGQVKDGKIAVGLAQLWHSDIAIDEIKMASDINEWARKYHPHTICYDKYATTDGRQCRCHPDRSLSQTTDTCRKPRLVGT